jgi:hypothetical protein
MACWDTTACLKTLCSAYNDFQKTPCDDAIKDLQRQIDVSLFILERQKKVILFLKILVI